MDLILGHGASGNAESMRPWVKSLNGLGVEVVAINLPTGKAERAVDRFRVALGEWPNAAIGGHSFGGRVASLLAAEQDVRALVLLSYPLHRPGDFENLRTTHWPAISCPVIALSGESDQFAKIGLLRASIPLLRQAEFVTYPGVGHGLAPVIDDASARIATFLAAH